jgi:predicted small secreted protein
MMHRTKLYLVALVASTALLAGCSQMSGGSGKGTDITEKKGDTVITGPVLKTNDMYFLSDPESPTPVHIDSYSVDLAEYEGKTVKITGQYSGDTLFVGKAEIVQ